MRNKTIKIASVAAVLCLVALSVMSCKKSEPLANTDDPGKTDFSGGSKEERYNSSILAMQGRRLSSEEIERLEEKLQADPEDLESRIKVLSWYSQQRFSSESARLARHKHILWIIQNHPDAPIAGYPEIALDIMLDQEVYYKAKKLWLEQTEIQKTNAVVLGNAAKFLFIHDRKTAEELLKKAQALEPENPEWPEQLGHIYSLGLVHETAEKRTELAAQALEQFEKSSTMIISDRKKFYKLGDLAKMAYEAGDMSKAENYANELLAQAVLYKSDWNYGNAIHHGNLILGRIALRSGDIGKAKQYLIKAGKTPGSPQLNSFGPNMTLAKELLEKNEREIVIQYFELCSNFWEMGQDDLKKWADITRDGNIPDLSANLHY